MSSMTETATRMRSEDRRELVLAAAMSVFGDRGYIGTTTDQVAKAAGVSQPYVVRMFGTKEKLFLEVLDSALRQLLDRFREVLADGGRPEDITSRLGNGYVGLLAVRGLLPTLMHAFLLGAEPAIGAAARSGFIDVFEFLRTEAGFDPEQATSFIAGGMLINTMIGTRMVESYDLEPAAKELLQCALPEGLELMLAERDR